MFNLFKGRLKLILIRVFYFFRAYVNRIIVQSNDNGTFSRLCRRNTFNCFNILKKKYFDIKLKVLVWLIELPL